MLCKPQIRGSKQQRGYIMMTLLLMIALMIIMAAAIAPTIAFEIRRDREEEMIHRGVQYSRAIRLYYKKFGRYPMKLEDLENTNQLRFLRKRYKDPLTGKDFKLLHFGEAKMAMNGMGGGMIPGASTIGTNGTLNSPNGLVQNSGFGNANSFGSNSAFGGNSSFGNNSGFGSNSNSAFGQSPQNTSNQSTGDAIQQVPDNNQAGSPNAANPNAPQPGGSSKSGDQLASTTFGGAPIVGVASLSKDRTIREFDKKKKYNEWQFVYDPTFDRGLLITTPYQPQLQQFGMQGTTNLNGQPTNGQNPNSSGFGNSFGPGTFGNSPTGMQNNPSPNGGYGNPNPPPNNPPQQQ